MTLKQQIVGNAMQMAVCTLQPGQTITITQSSVSLEELLGKFIFSVTSLNGSKSGDQSKTGGSANSGSDGGKSGGGLAPLPK